jgi:hypothetical protein
MHSHNDCIDRSSFSLQVPLIINFGKVPPSENYLKYVLIYVLELVGQMFINSSITYDSIYIKIYFFPLSKTLKSYQYVISFEYV